MKKQRSPLVILTRQLHRDEEDAEEPLAPLPSPTDFERPLVADVNRRDEELVKADKSLRQLDLSSRIQQRSQIVIAYSALILVLVGGGGYIGYRAVKHEKWRRGVATLLKRQEEDAKRREQMAKGTVLTLPPAIRADLQEAEKWRLAGQVDQEVAAYRQSLQRIKAQPDLPNSLWLRVNLLNRLGTTLGNARRFPEAVNALREARTLWPGNSDLANNLGVALIGAGKQTKQAALFSEAAKVLREAIDYNPGNVRAHHNLSLALAYAGDAAGAQRARAAYQEAVKRSEAAQTTPPDAGLSLSPNGALGLPP